MRSIPGVRGSAPGCRRASPSLWAGFELFRLRDDIVPFTFALSLIILGGTLVVVVASNVMNFENAMPPGEYHFLLLSAVRRCA